MHIRFVRFFSGQFWIRPIKTPKLATEMSFSEIIDKWNFKTKLKRFSVHIYLESVPIQSRFSKPNPNDTACLMLLAVCVCEHVYTAIYTCFHSGVCNVL